MGKLLSGDYGDTSILQYMKMMNGGRSRQAEKGQKRNAKSKASGVATSKRLATKRNNIRKHG